MSLTTNDIKFNVKNGLSVGASGFEVINTNAEWVGTEQSPYGATGAHGYDGATGPTGATGPAGATGVIGATGEKGITGINGERGEDGASGATGVIGATGDEGQQGVTGDGGTTGQQGLDGIRGPDGVLGPTGDQGWDGTNGVRTYNAGNQLVIWAGSDKTASGYAQLEFNSNTHPIYLALLAGSVGDTIHVYLPAGWEADAQIIDNSGTVTPYSGAYAISISKNPLDEPNSFITANDFSTSVTYVNNMGYTGATGATGPTGATGVNGARYHTTSTTNLNLTTGATGVVVVDEYLNYSTGQTILLADGAGKHIHATVDSYDPITKILAFTPTDHVGTGSSSSWEINLDGAEGPIGATGITGQDGATGPLGDQGYQGTSGERGTTGDDGQQGVDGHVGTQGSLGVTGQDGDQGPDGQQGWQGILGHTGEDGAEGPQGDQGPVGEDGLQGITGATGYTGATGAQGGDGSAAGETIYRAGNWYNLYYVGSSNAYGAPILAFHPANPVIYNALAALQVGDSITIDFTASGQVSPQTVTVTETITSDGLYNPYKIKVSASPDNNPSAQINGSNNLDNITLPGTGPTNTGYTGSTGATGAKGPIGNRGFDADQLTYGTPVGEWNNITVYNVDDVVVYSDGKSYRCIQGGYSNMFPDSETAVWRETAFAGASGEQGYQGSRGPTGETGTDGASGITGASGVTGATGADGASGVIGLQGEQGVFGWQGLPGATGYIGATGVTGETGTDGATGYHGLQFNATADGNYSVQAVNSNIYLNLNVNPQTGDYTYSYSADQDIVIAKDIDNYMIATVVSYSAGVLHAIVKNAYGNASSVSGWVVNLDGAVGIIGATGVTGEDGDQGPIGDQGTQGGNGAELITIPATVTYELAAAWLEYPTLMGSYIRIQGPVAGIMPGMTVTYGAVTYTVYSYTENNDSTSFLTFTNYPVTSGAIPASANIVIEGYSAPTNTGYTGATGAIGIQGASGVTGDQGETGPQGDQGINGSIGFQGATGFNGDIGTQGVTGDQGYTGQLGYGLVSGATGLSTTSQATVDIFAANEVGTAKYLVQAVDGSTNVQATEVILTQNSSGVYMTEYATLRTGATGYNVMSVTATSNGSVVSLKVTPTVSNTNISWVRESIVGRIGGTTVHDVDGTHIFYSRTNSDNGAIPAGKAYVYPGSYWYSIINFSSLIGTSVTFDDAGVGPQLPAIGTIDSWDGGTLVVTITSGNFTSRNYLDKITYGY